MRIVIVLFAGVMVYATAASAQDIKPWVDPVDGSGFPSSKTFRPIVPPKPIQPVCTPSRWEIMEYWRSDFFVYRHQVSIGTQPQGLKQIFGTLYEPLRDAVGKGMTTPSQEYADAVTKRNLARDSSRCRPGDPYCPLRNVTKTP